MGINRFTPEKYQNDAKKITKLIPKKYQNDTKKITKLIPKNNKIQQNENKNL